MTSDHFCAFMKARQATSGARRPFCGLCGMRLILTRIEPEEPGFDLRTYYCAACEDTEVIIAAI
jgi:hypothetical protein